MQTKIPRIVPSLPNWILAAIFSALATLAIMFANYFEEAGQVATYAG